MEFFSPVTLSSMSDLEIKFLELVLDVEWPVFISFQDRYFGCCVCVPIFSCIRQFTIDDYHKSKKQDLVHGGWILS